MPDADGAYHPQVRGPGARPEMRFDVATHTLRGLFENTSLLASFQLAEVGVFARENFWLVVATDGERPTVNRTLGGNRGRHLRLGIIFS